MTMLLLLLLLHLSTSVFSAWSNHSWALRWQGVQFVGAPFV